MRGADAAIPLFDLDGERNTVMQPKPAPGAADTAFYGAQRLAVGVTAFKTCLDQLFPDVRQIADMRAEQVDALTTRYLRIEIVFLRHLPQDDQLVRGDLPAGDPWNDGITSPLLDIGEITVIAILDRRLLDRRLAPQARHDAGHHRLAHLAAIPLAPAHQRLVISMYVMELDKIEKLLPRMVEMLTD